MHRIARLRVACRPGVHIQLIRKGDNCLSLNNQEAGEEVRSIIGIRKERRYLLPDEEEGVLPVAEASPEPEESEHQLIPFERIGSAADEDIAPANSAQAIPDSVDVEHGAIP